jgi:hypothetical protein
MYPAGTAAGHVGKSYVEFPVAPKRPTTSRIYTLYLRALHGAISVKIRHNYSPKCLDGLIIFPKYSVHNYIQISPPFSQAATSIYEHFLFSTFPQNM